MDKQHNDILRIFLDENTPMAREGAGGNEKVDICFWTLFANGVNHVF